MDSIRTNGIYKGKPATISFSPVSVTIEQPSQELLIIPTSHIIAIYPTAPEKRSQSQSRVGADILVATESSHDQDQASDNKDDPIRFENHQIEFASNDNTPFSSSLSPLFLAQLPSHLLLPSTDGQPNIHVIISTLSGTCKAENFFEICLRPLLDHLAVTAYQVHRTENANSISTFTRDVILPRANHGLKQLIILLSGDGGMVDIVNSLLTDPNSLMGKNAVVPIVALIPMGTGNALFHSTCTPLPPPPLPQDIVTKRSSAEELNLHQDKTQGLRTLLLGSAKPLPTFTVTFSKGCTVVSYSQSSAPDSSSAKLIHTPLPSPSVMHSTVLLSWCLHASLVSLSDHPSHRAKGSSRFAAAAQALLNPADGQPMHVYQGEVSFLQSKNINSNKEKVTATEAKAESQWTPLKDADGSIRTKHTYLLLTLVRKLEKIFTVSPLSQPLDGKLRLISVGEVGAQELVGVLGRGYRDGVGNANSDVGAESEPDVVGYQEVQEGLRIRFLEEDAVAGEEKEGQEITGTGVGRGKWRRVCIDGTVVECPKGGWVQATRNKTGEKKAVELVTLALSDL